LGDLLFCSVLFQRQHFRSTDFEMSSGRKLERCLKSFRNDDALKSSSQLFWAQVSPLKSNGVACHGTRSLDSIGVNVGVHVMYLYRVVRRIAAVQKIFWISHYLAGMFRA
jgi:hypothetical protein